MYCESIIAITLSILIWFLISIICINHLSALFCIDTKFTVILIHYKSNKRNGLIKCIPLDSIVHPIFSIMDENKKHMELIQSHSDEPIQITVHDTLFGFGLLFHRIYLKKVD